MIQDNIYGVVLLVSFLSGWTWAWGIEQLKLWYKLR